MKAFCCVPCHKLVLSIIFPFLSLYAITLFDNGNVMSMVFVCVVCMECNKNRSWNYVNCFRSYPFYVINIYIKAKTKAFKSKRIEREKKKNVLNNFQAISFTRYLCPFNWNICTLLSFILCSIFLVRVFYLLVSASYDQINAVFLHKQFRVTLAKEMNVKN